MRQTCGSGSQPCERKRDQLWKQIAGEVEVVERAEEEGRKGGNALFDVVPQQRRVEEEGDDLEREKEEGRHERVCDHLGQDELVRARKGEG